MLLAGDLVIDFFDRSIRCDEKAHALGIDLPIRTVRRDDHFVRIGKEWERQIILLRKSRMTFRIVFAHAQNHHLREKIPETIPEPACFLRTPRRVVLRVEIEKKPTTRIIFERMNYAGLIASSEGRSGITGF